MNFFKKGFTLLELIIVIIIISILAALGFPKLTAQVERSRSAEALNTVGIVSRAIQSCALLNGSVTGCDTFAAIGLESNPGDEPGALFDYAIELDPPESYKITATRKLDPKSGGDGKSQIIMSVTSSERKIYGTLKYEGIRSR